jgi:hypothetical protein
MSAKKYPVVLTDDERHGLAPLLRGSQHATRPLTRAGILLKAVDGLRDEDIAEVVETRRPTVERTRKRFATARLAALTERPYSHAPDGRQR